MMILKKFTVRVSVRLLLILSLMVILSLIIGDSQLFFNQIILGVPLFIMITELLRYVNRTYRELSKFLMAIKHSDFNINFTNENTGSSFDELQKAFEEVILAYEDLRLGERATDQFMEHLVNQLNIGIIALNGNDIILINKKAVHFLGVKEAHNWNILLNECPEFCEHIESLSNEGTNVSDVLINGETMSLLVDISKIILMEESHKLIVFRNVKQEMEVRELEAWLKLIRILTHEIMNSSTPIISLTETMQSMLEKDGQQRAVEELTQEMIGDIRFSLETIKRRSESMLEFVRDYRELTRIPHPKKELVNLSDMIVRIKSLHQSILTEKSIEIEYSELKGELSIDSILIEQVFINLITNSIYALRESEEPKIIVRGQIENSRYLITICDNGTGIPEKEIGDIFIPFFSTREHGSGIGLSLSRQIISLHGGTIKVE